MEAAASSAVNGHRDRRFATFDEDDAFLGIESVVRFALNLEEGRTIDVVVTDVGVGSVGTVESGVSRKNLCVGVLTDGGSPGDHGRRNLDQFRAGKLSGECLSTELLPPGLGLAIEHDQIVVPEIAGRSEIEQLTVECALEDEGRVAERTERHGHRNSADGVVDDLVPDQNLNWVDAHVTADLEDDHRLARIDVRVCLVDGGNGGTSIAGIPSFPGPPL